MNILQKIKSSAPYLVLAVCIGIFGYLSYEVGKIAAYESTNPGVDYLQFKSAAIQAINANSQQTQQIINFLNSQIKK